jgi:hypothetical protein
MPRSNPRPSRLERATRAVALLFEVALLAFIVLVAILGVGAILRRWE